MFSCLNIKYKQITAHKVILIKLITCHIPEAYIAGIEELVNMNMYPNRSEVIRVAIRDLLKTELSTLLRKE